MRLSVVIPLFNEQDNLRPIHAQLKQALSPLNCEIQIIFVDDGSTDSSPRILGEIAREDASVQVLILSRNFGHEAASTAGLDAATGDAVVLMDADLQDPPETIPQMLEKWRQGAQIVLAVRRTRHGESFFKKITSWLFYRIVNFLADISFPKDAGDFRLIDARVLDALKQMREQDRFVRGLIAWTGFETAKVEYDRPARHAGRTKYNPIKLFLLSVDAAVGFSTKPLRLASGLGFIVTIISLEEAARIFVEKLVWNIKIPGYALQTVGLFFLGGVQMLLLGVIGEYIGRIYRHSQNRPLYIVAQKINEK
ncbi:MAG TPA: glycosyltransferase family 2 protein [Tepidisphaeraceae bacterium]|nr:glycosyltransferase family 2 protein [Tepidisphaeraceae bacterium]